MSSNSGQYSYSSLNNDLYNNSINSNNCYSPSQYLNNSSSTTNTTHIFPENLSIDITARDQLEKMYVYVVLLSIITSMLFTSVIFTQCYLWYSVYQEYSDIKILYLLSLQLVLL